jgi:hypothetical protein
MKALIFTSAMVLLCTSARAAQENPMGHSYAGGHTHFMHGGVRHKIAKGVRLEEKMDAATHTITLREGPMQLPARTSHEKMPQPADLMWKIPIDGWLLAYHPRLVDGAGNAVPGQVLHHTAFWNVNRSDFLCPNKEEHIFGAGSEMNDWMPVPGYGYRVGRDEEIRIETMVYNPTETSYKDVWLEVQIAYQEAGGAGPALKNVYPAWMDVMECRDSGYDLKAGDSVTKGTVPVKYSGVLLGVGGHMHDYGKQLVLEDKTRKETMATLEAKNDAQGHNAGTNLVLFLDRGGYRLEKGDVLGISATYDNPTGKMLRDGAMGIVVGYFVPDDDTAMAALRRAPRPMAAHGHHAEHH